MSEVVDDPLVDPRLVAAGRKPVVDGSQNEAVIASVVSRDEEEDVYVADRRLGRARRFIAPHR
ncbi:MAG: hypothetical protein DMD82_13590 [Candidatus Rokuibacteriota bacterium]|nr:MAG: hypothetical protein DMD82_13590 [Candidatus Rokubacteria bacterium]